MAAATTSMPSANASFSRTPFVFHRYRNQGGQAQSQEIEASMKLLEDAVVNGYIDRIGPNLVHNSDATVPFTFKIIDSSEVAALALPGGYLYVTTGLIQSADSEAELAGMMAHGVAHVAARHAMRMRTREEIAKILTVPLIGDGGPRVEPTKCRESGRLSRFFVSPGDDEVEADYFGVQYLYQAGYEPEGFVRFLEKLEKEQPATPSELDRSLAAIRMRLSGSRQRERRFPPSCRVVIIRSAPPQSSPNQSTAHVCISQPATRRNAVRRIRNEVRCP